MLERAPPQDFHAGAESLAQGRSRSAARHYPEGAAGAHLLHDASQNCSADISDVHQPENPLHFSYERFLENQIRAKFDFVGTPIRFIQRLRKRQDKHGDAEN